MKKISVLGSTGSIGTQTLEVVRQNQDKLVITAMSAGRNVDLFEKQVREFKPAIACMGDEEAAADLKQRISDLSGIRVLAGMDGMLEMASDPGSEIMVTAIVGMIGIRPTIAAIESGKDIALANKETLVCAGHIIMPLAKKMGIRILPVDSEHSAIFQSLQGSPAERISRIILTCSGGPFRGMKKEELADKTCEDALKHPNWNMGRKITIDSATLVNKGLEVMEASWLFGVGTDRVCVTIHPQS
ncbi:MAG: 1-deoxy-D-xylulose-5-phosphate reductoisomerase, partial [Lachnospiraceae bacterium]|nr:1-deoxy-D-xylulose-5-phosphate reductoisomerase [Lachnospiraceae bacterium]